MDEALDRLRHFCALLPETSEVDALGLPTFRVSVKGFAVYEVVGGAPTVCVKLLLDQQEELLTRSGVWAEGDTGHRGWTVIDLTVVPWDEVDPLVLTSYRNVAAPEFVAQLDELLGEA